MGYAPAPFVEDDKKTLALVLMGTNPTADGAGNGAADYAEFGNTTFTHLDISDYESVSINVYKASAGTLTAYMSDATASDTNSLGTGAIGNYWQTYKFDIATTSAAQKYLRLTKSTGGNMRISCILVSRGA